MCSEGAPQEGLTYGPLFTVQQTVGTVKIRRDERCEERAGTVRINEAHFRGWSTRLCLFATFKDLAGCDKSRLYLSDDSVDDGSAHKNRELISVEVPTSDQAARCISDQYSERKNRLHKCGIPTIGT